MIKKILGYIFIGLSILLILSVFLRLPEFTSEVSKLILAIRGKANDYEIAKNITQIIFWLGQFLSIYVLLSFGRDWIKNTKNQ